MPLIKYKKKTYAGGSMPVLEMTKAQYDALSEAKKNDGTIYLITDGTGGWEAENSVYDNTESGLTATNVQDALDEVNSNLSKAFKIKYQSTNWATLHSFPVESVPRIGLILTHDGTLYSFAQYDTGNIDIQKIAGSHTITKSVVSGYNRLSVDANVGLIVLVS